ncbi:hypothetical protein ACFE04_027314 [Oxalis oulophora]
MRCGDEGVVRGCEGEDVVRGCEGAVRGRLWRIEKGIEAVKVRDCGGAAQLRSNMVVVTVEGQRHQTQSNSCRDVVVMSGEAAQLRGGLGMRVVVVETAEAK